MSNGLLLGWGSGGYDWAGRWLSEPLYPSDFVTNSGTSYTLQFMTPEHYGGTFARFGIDTIYSTGYTFGSSPVALKFTWKFTPSDGGQPYGGEISHTGNTDEPSTLGASVSAPFGATGDDIVAGVLTVTGSVNGIPCDNELVLTLDPAPWSYGLISWYQRAREIPEVEPTPFWAAFVGTSEILMPDGNILSKGVSSRFTPAVPPVPSVPGRWVEYEEVGRTCVTGVTGSDIKWYLQDNPDESPSSSPGAYSPNNSRWPPGHYPPYPAPNGKRWVASGSYSTGTTCTTGAPVKVKKWQEGTPGKPGVPENLVIDYKEGWDSSASSIAEIDPTADTSCSPDGAWFSFKMPRAIGVAVGLSGYYATTSVEHIGVGFQFSGPSYRIIIDGVVGSSVYPYQPLDTFIIRSFGTHFVLRNDSDGAQWTIHANEAKLYSPVAKLLALFYMGGDKLITGEASKVTACSSGGAMAPMGGFGFAGSYARMDGIMQPMIGYGGVRSGGVGNMAPIRGLGMEAGRFGVGVMASMEGSGGYSGGYIDKSYGMQLMGKMTPVYGAGIVQSGHSGGQDPWDEMDGAGAMAPLQAYGYEGEPFATQSVGMMAPMRGAGLGLIEGWVTVDSRARTFTTIMPFGYVAAVITSRGTLKALLDVQQMVGAAVDSQAQGAAHWQLDAALLAFIDSVVQGAASVGGRGQAVSGDPDRPVDFDAGDQVWVLNTRTGAVSRYQNYSFNSFALIGGHYFGADEGGVYLLEGELDGEAPIHTRIQTGQMDLGSRQLKHVSNVYLGVASDGVLSVTVQVNGQQYTYRARRSDRYSQQQRVDTGKGLRATLYGFELVNSSRFELDSLDINVVQSGRRI